MEKNYISPNKFRITKLKKIKTSPSRIFFHQILNATLAFYLLPGVDFEKRDTKIHEMKHTSTACLDVLIFPEMPVIHV